MQDEAVHVEFHGCMVSMSLLEFEDNTSDFLRHLYATGATEQVRSRWNSPIAEIKKLQ